MKFKYYRNSFIVAAVVGTVVWALEHGRVDPPSLVWCISMFFIAIVGVDYAKGQKIFEKK